MILTRKKNNPPDEERKDLPFFLQNAVPRLLLFGGKGGVGKTTCATTVAFHLASNSPRDDFLLVSTDPAHSLSDCIAGVDPPRNLEILELDSNQCMESFKAQHLRKLHEIAKRGTFLDGEDIDKLLELSLPGLDELMAFLEISKWLNEDKYDHIIVDTAPTGHTLRLLSLPAEMRKWFNAVDALLAKHRYMKKVFTGLNNPDEIDHFLESFSDSVIRAEALLRNPRDCRFVPVTLPESLSICETGDLIDALVRLSIPITDIVVNKICPSNNCWFCAARRSRQMEELMPLCHDSKFSRLHLWGVSICPHEILSSKNLTAFWETVTELKRPVEIPKVKESQPGPGVENPQKLPPSEMVLLLFAGKGGVGKTTLACATAMQLAGESQGREILLFSSDPAHSLSDCLGLMVGPKPVRVAPGVTAMEIDAQGKFDTLKAEYSEELEIFFSAFNNFDPAFDREAMERILDLTPPGVDEVMALTQVMDFLSRRKYDIFILDSAATGHLIRLLELPEILDQWLKVFFGILLKYKNVLRVPKLSRQLVEISRNLKILQALLTDGNRSGVFAVATLTEMTFRETQDLFASCQRLGFTVRSLFLNLATPANDCSVCRDLNSMETRIRDKFQENYPEIHQTLVYQQIKPFSVPELQKLGDALYVR